MTEVKVDNRGCRYSILNRLKIAFLPERYSSAVRMECCLCYDDVEIGGAAIENGDFETAGSNGLPSMWQPLGKPVYDVKSGKAHGGSSFVKCSSDDRLNRNITVEGGKPVTVSFWIKAD